MITLLAALFAALAAWLATPRPPAPQRLATLGTATRGTGMLGTATRGIAPRGTGMLGTAPRGAAPFGTAALDTAVHSSVAHSPVVHSPIVHRSAVDAAASTTLTLRGGVVATVAGRVRAQRWRKESGVRWSEAGVELCQSMAAELRAGRTPADALRASVEVLPGDVRAALRGVSAVASAGGDVPAELAAVADGDPGAASLRQVAAAWQVGAASGSSLADVLERVAQTLRDDQAHRAQVAAQLAGPRATARLLAALPLLGLALAASSGAHPLDFLFGTPAGLACLTAGLGLDALGLWWSTQITKAALTPTQ